MNDYDILEIDKNASINEIKIAYIKLAKKYHPDKNNNIDASDKFIQVQEAYKNMVKKKTGNKYYNIFTDLYNEGIFDKYVNLLYNKIIYNNTGNNKTIVINCNLEELYNSCIKTIKYTRRITTSPIDYVMENKIINLNISSKNYNNQKIIYERYGDGIEYGKPINDLIIIIKEEEHDLYERIGNDLFINIDLSLKEALTYNTTINIPLLNNTFYNHKIDKIINPGYQDTIKNFGMPISDTNFGMPISDTNFGMPISDTNFGMPISDTNFGNLIMKFNIIFPLTLTDIQINNINNIL